MTSPLLAPLTAFNKIAASIPDSLVALIARFAVAYPFWISGRNKVNGWDFWNVNDATVFLFEYEFQLPLLSPHLAATLASIGEHILPVLLALGLLTRFGAAGLIVMTAVIQFLAVPSGWPTHLLWFAPLLYLLAHGGGAISLDRVFGLDQRRG